MEVDGNAKVDGAVEVGGAAEVDEQCSTMKGHEQGADSEYANPGTRHKTGACAGNAEARIHRNAVSYRGTPLIRKRTPLGPFSTLMSRTIGGS